MELYFCRGSRRKKNDGLIIISNILFQDVGSSVFRCNSKLELLEGFKKNISKWKKM